MVVKGYRDAAGLSQEGLAELLKDDTGYSGSRDRSQISNYERGKVLPSKQFLSAFLKVIEPGLAEKGIELDDQDADHLFFFAGYYSQPTADVSDLRTSVTDVKVGQETLRAGVEDVRHAQVMLQGGLYDLSQRVSDSLSINERIKDALVKMVPPALYVATIGYVIDALGLVRTWVMLAYLAIGIAVVVSTVMLRRFRTDASDRVGDLFFVSVFFVMSVSLLQAAFTRMDLYGFHTLPQFTGGAVPFMLAMIVNLVLSLASSIMFNVLRNWLRGESNSLSPVSRAVWATLLPTAFLYTNVLLFCNPGMWVFFLVNLGTLFGAFAAIILFKDPRLRVDARDSWMIKAAFAAIVVMAAFFGVGTLVTFVAPSLVSSAHHNTLWSSDADLAPLDLPPPEYFDALGYPEDEYFERIRFGMLWTNQATTVYFVVVFGIAVLSAIRSRMHARTASAWYHD